MQLNKNLVQENGEMPFNLRMCCSVCLRTDCADVAMQMLIWSGWKYSTME